MKNEKKRRKIKRHNARKHTVKKQKVGALGEVLYNCPYLIAVVVTSLAVMVCSDKIGIRAIAKDAETIVRQTMGNSVSVDEIPIDVASEPVSENGNVLENTGENNLEEMENAGERKEENDDIEGEDELENDGDALESAENTEETVVGVTKYEIYEPQEIDSYYYSDAGKVALTTEYPYTKENDSYFNDAVFLGDSRTLGISDYAGLDEADFYCDSGMMLFKLLAPEGVTYQKTGNKEDLTQVLQQKQYGKVYIMLGMNELGYGNTEMYLEQYRKVVDQIREWQPDAIIYIMANLHVSRAKNNPETEFNNININDKNAASASLANGIDIFYLDANPLFTDEEGYLNADWTFDGVHLYAQHYDVWREFLLEHAVEPKE
ncbi:MAG: hypothetical protein J1F42_10740 [Lachnospiraceae bacterium]|nr:hypothetical protein [Lachnospiraceae bacterium]